MLCRECYKEPPSSKRAVAQIADIFVHSLFFLLKIFLNYSIKNFSAQKNPRHIGQGFFYGSSYLKEVK